MLPTELAQTRIVDNHWEHAPFPDEFREMGARKDFMPSQISASITADSDLPNLRQSVPAMRWLRSSSHACHYKVEVHRPSDKGLDPGRCSRDVGPGSVLCQRPGPPRVPQGAVERPHADGQQHGGERGQNREIAGHRA